jgi:SAM-dependent methyltransferase
MNRKTMRLATTIGSIALLVLLSVPCAVAQEPNLDVPFVPTPPEVVTEMLKLANVHKGDLLYDLGCGDGRIVIAAAEKFGARGVGIDIDPERIKEAQENAQKAGVADRVKFVQQNLFEADVSKATVVTLYLLSEVNLKLRPKLLKELRPGTRIVSHSFDMGDWKPDKQVEIGWRKLYFWVVPPRAEGKK